MSAVEVIGFLIALCFFIFLVMRNFWEEYRRRTNPEEYEASRREQEKRLKEFLGALSQDMEEDEEKIHKNPPPPPPIPMHVLTKASPIDTAHHVDTSRHEKSHRTLGDDFAFHTTLDAYKPKETIGSRQFKTSIDKRYEKLSEDEIVNPELEEAHIDKPYEITVQSEIPRVRKRLASLSSKQDLVIFNEILGLPKAFRRSNDIPSSF